MVDSAEVDAADAARVDEAAHGLDVAGEQDPAAGIGPVARELRLGVGDAEKVHLHLRRHAHAVELLLPLARRDFVVDENNEPDIEGLPPPDDHLAMDEAIVDTIENDRHAISPPAQER